MLSSSKVELATKLNPMEAPRFPVFRTEKKLRKMPEIHGRKLGESPKTIVINGMAPFMGYTLPETNSSHLKMDGWKMNFLLGWTIFRCYVSFRECNPIYNR